MAQGQLQVRTGDGAVLSAQLFNPPGDVRTSILIAGAFCVKQSFYWPLAHWLQQQGCRVMTFDPRGSGLSRVTGQSLKFCEADMLKWARVDFAAAVAALAKVSEGGKVVVIGHSLGLHLAGLTDAATQSKIQHVVAVAAGAGYWKTWAAPTRRLAPLLLYVLIPLLTPIFGYFPGKRLRLLGDVPAGVIKQWSSWCRNPQFAWGAEPEKVIPSFRAASFHITAFSFTDDESMTEECTRTLLREFSSAASTVEVIRPADVGLQSIGHLGAFRINSAQGIWTRLLAAALAPVEHQGPSRLRLMELPA